jgi:hypothetical protein
MRLIEEVEAVEGAGLATFCESQDGRGGVGGQNHLHREFEFLEKVVLVER